MNEAQDNGGPAFPVHPDLASRLGCANSSSDAGMTLRDYFAAKAMQTAIGLTATSDNVDGLDVCKRCYVWADSMLEARK